MENALPGSRARIDDHAIAFFSDPDLIRHLRGDPQHVAEHDLVLRSSVVQRIHVLAGDDQDVPRRLRIDVFERHNVIILVEDVRRKLMPSTPRTAILLMVPPA